MPLVALQAKAAAGDAGAQIQLAIRHNAGLGVEFRTEKIREWMVKAANSGHRTAIGICAVNGWGRSRDLVLALQCLKEQYEKGDITATRLLARLYADGLGVKQDRQRAFQLYLKAAESNDPIALRFLAGAYENGEGTSKDTAKAHSYYSQSHLLGDRVASYDLARLFMAGDGCVKDTSRAIILIEVSAECGYPPALMYLGQRYHGGQSVTANLEKAFGYWQRAASLGSPSGIHQVAMCYEKGIHVRADKVTPLFLYRSSAVLGYLESHLRLAELLQAQPNIAREHWLKAGELGSGVGYHQAGLSYEKEKDYKMANDLYEKAIKLGYLGSEYQLGLNQVNGRGIKKGLEKGAGLILRSYKNGFVQGIPEKEHLARVDADIEFFRLLHSVPGLTDTIKVGSENKTPLESTAQELRSEAWKLRLSGRWLEAIHLYLIAGGKGEGEAWHRLGGMSHDGKELPKDDTLAISFLHKAVVLNSGSAHNRLGYHYLNGFGCEKDDVSARYHFELAATLKDGHGASNSGMMWSQGLGGPKDEAKAFSYYQKAAELADASGTNQLGHCYSVGTGVSKNIGKAFEYYLKAAKMGHRDGAFNAAYAYHLGKGVRQDISKAVLLYKLAVTEDSAPACNNLAGILTEGKGGVQKDARLARALYEKAARLGNKESQDYLRRVGLSKARAKVAIQPYKDKQVTDLLAAARQDLDKEKLLESIKKCQEAISRLNPEDPGDWLPWTLAHATLAGAFNAVTMSVKKIELPSSFSGNSMSQAMGAAISGRQINNPLSVSRKIEALLPDRWSRLLEEELIAASFGARLWEGASAKNAKQHCSEQMKEFRNNNGAVSPLFRASANKAVAWVILRGGIEWGTEAWNWDVEAGIGAAEDALFFASLEEVTTPSQRIFIARCKVLLACGLIKGLAKQSSSEAALDSTRIEELLIQAGLIFAELCPGTTDAASIFSLEDDHKLAMAVIRLSKLTLKQLINGDSTPTPKEDKGLNSLILDDASSQKKDAPGTKPGADQPAPRELK